MRATEFITELNMAPGNLLKFANSPKAENMYAGFEAELIFPGSSGFDDDDNSEPDLDNDPGVDWRTDLIDIKEFFDIRNAHHRHTMKLEEEYSEWLSEKCNDWINDNYDEQFETEKEEHPDEDEDELRDKVNERLSEDFYNGDVPTLGEFLNDQGIDSMYGIFDNYGTYLDWPNWKSPGSDGTGAADLADSLKSVLNVNAVVSNGYHATTRDNSTWIFEPDSSITPEDDDYFGVELISPPMPVITMLNKMGQTFAWAQRYGALTNDSTGLHVGVSIKGMSAVNVDYIKLALFLGDQYVLQQFGRAANSYTSSAMALIQKRVSVPNLNLSGLRKGLLQTISQSILARNTSRSTSINVKDEYIEFRSMGGDYINDFEKVKNTVLRYVQAYAIASDPNAYRQEYAKKLTRLLNPQQDDNLIPFVQYAMGSLNKNGLIRALYLRQGIDPSEEARSRENERVQTTYGQAPVEDPNAVV